MRLSKLERARHATQSLHARMRPPEGAKLDLDGLINLLLGGPVLPTQRDYILSPERIKWFTGPYGSGKTTALAAATLLPALLYPGSSWLVARWIYWTLEETTMKAFDDAFNRLGREIVVDEVKGPPRKVYLASPRLGKGGVTLPPSEILFQGLDDIGKLGSTKFSGISVDEANEIPGAMVTTLNSRLRYKRPTVELVDGSILSGELTGPNGEAHPAGPFFLNLASNPPTRSHHLHKNFCCEEDCEPQPIGKKFKSTPQENARNLPKGYYDQIAVGMSGASLLRFVEGECGPDPRPGDAVFGKEFNYDIHTGTLKFDTRFPLIRGWDFGRRRPAVVWAQRLPNGWVNRFRAVLGENTNIKRFAQRVKAETAIYFPALREVIDFCDPHGTQKRDTSDKSSIDFLNEEGVFPRWKDTRIETGLEYMTAGLTTMIQGRPRSMYDRVGCARIIEGYMSGYVYPMHKEGAALKDKPLADGYYEHMMDADRYIEVGLNMLNYDPSKHRTNLRKHAPNPDTGR